MSGGQNQLPVPAPKVTTTNAGFWAATAGGQFTLQRCTACELVIWFPRRTCPKCRTEDIQSCVACGRGSVYSFTVVRKGSGAYREAAPFVVAYVELEEGPRVLTNITGCDPADVTVGMAVEIEWHDTGEGNAIYRFRPAPG
ncbi:MAG: Zn-ribbon domain-containing OB-fold protein [Actinomycetota bacterium]